jgi:hypothetical protein
MVVVVATVPDSTATDAIPLFVDDDDGTDVTLLVE